jgi:hypothetical protein
LGDACSPERIQHYPENKSVEVVNKADLRYEDSRQELEQRR